MHDRLTPDGPGPIVQGRRHHALVRDRPHHEYKFASDIVATYRNKTYVLAWITPDKSLDHREGQKHWHLTNATPGAGQHRRVRSSASQFDSQGRRVLRRR